MLVFCPVFSASALTHIGQLLKAALPVCRERHVRGVHLATIFLWTLLVPTSSLGSSSWSTEGCRWSSRGSLWEGHVRESRARKCPVFSFSSGCSPGKIKEDRFGFESKAFLGGKEGGNNKASHGNGWERDKIGFCWAPWDPGKRREREGESWAQLVRWDPSAEGEPVSFPWELGKDRIGGK